MTPHNSRSPELSTRPPYRSVRAAPCYAVTRLITVVKAMFVPLLYHILQF